jgi:hypothetical protein
VDNRFHSAIGRFPDIEEDAAPKYLIFQDYKKYIKNRGFSKTSVFGKSSYPMEKIA